jgi:Cu2+-exporting ATPase
MARARATCAARPCVLPDRACATPWNDRCSTRRDVAAAVSRNPSDLKRSLECRHCGSALASGARTEFCCTGCESVFTFLHGAGLDRYYDLRGPSGVPAIAAGADAAKKSDRKWLEPIANGLADRKTLSHVELDVQGMHCSACVWLLDEMFRRQEAGAGIVVNPAIGRADLTVAPSFDLRAFVDSVEQLGYRFGPPVKAAAARSSDIVWRMGVCIAIAMNTMIFGVAIYAGLASGPVYRVFQAVTFGLSFVSVIVGGTVFFRSAWRSLKKRALHLDLPIALGILLAFASSTHAYVVHGGSRSFFDTLNVFIALMLVGRFLQERVVAKNRADILDSSGAEHVYTRRLDAEGEAELVPCKDVAPGDRLLVARADLVPVDAVLESPGSFSLDWISGESRPIRFAAGDTVPAGAFSCNDGAIVARAIGPFETSALAALLRTTRAREDDAARATPFWRRLSKVYVTLVLVLSLGGFAGWMLATGDVTRSLAVVTALLIVTCPCAFGIATPLAYELAQAGLRRAGLFVRSAGFLDRAAPVRRVVFDKTGTLTTGMLRVAEGLDSVDALSPEERRALFDMAQRSAHPKSEAVLRAMRSTAERAPQPFRGTLVEHPGLGVELVRDGRTFRLGAPSWAGDRVRWFDRRADVVFSKDGIARAGFVTEEELRADAAGEVAAIGALGLETWILSGDAPARVSSLAEACGVAPERAKGGASPADKERLLRELDRGDVLFVGDGINDALAAEAATCAGTPAIDRPFMASKSDFYLVTPGLRPVRLALLVARKVRSVVVRNLALATAYNAVTIALALAGLMSPLACAVLMPLASVSTVLATTLSLSRRHAVWRS